MMPIPVALTIAGSDSSGGAGIQADLKAFARCGAHGMSAIVALTAQNTADVRAIHEVPPVFVRAQIDAVLDDIGADAAKTGMLFSSALIEAGSSRNSGPSAIAFLIAGRSASSSNQRFALGNSSMSMSRVAQLDAHG